MKLRLIDTDFVCMTIGIVVSAHAIAEPLAAREPTSRYIQDAHRILAAKCFPCHGPDAGQREAGLRLDSFEGSTQELPSGQQAIIPGNAAASSLILRIKHDAIDQRMPPPDSSRQLSTSDTQTLEQWIQSGAEYPEHWAFMPHNAARPPKVQRVAWAVTPVDRYVLARLEAKGLSPAPRADRYTLIRRVYFDLIGLPPTAEQINQFVNDPSPKAWPQLIDRLLASPHYGERWGRHWLDVARYGDSNGGDENHKLPHAYHYRDYVITAFNADTAYDRFLLEQLAGDLFTTQGLPSDQLAATGFLALGMKILAEQDPAKKRADVIDEQIDTLGRSILGLTLGCARCHDHKFDPISTADYYALFGIFQSTNLADRELETASFLAAVAEHKTTIEQASQARTELQTRLDQLLDDPQVIQREAESFERGNVLVDDAQYGEGIGIISDPGTQSNYVEYDVEVHLTGEYQLQVRYAAHEARPGRVLLDGVLVDDDAIAAQTGGWMPGDQQWFDELQVNLTAGTHVLRIESKPMMSHIDKWRLIPTDISSPAIELFEQVRRLDAKLADLKSKRPSSTTVMAVNEGSLANARIHQRGDHMSLGDEVPRRFLEILDTDEPTHIPADQSGRWQLAEWLTAPDGNAASLSSRVMANRIWHWHFGRGLVETPDQFGIKGSRPSHPGLLDYLARELMRGRWSVKSLHRQILLSNTYQSSNRVTYPSAEELDPENKLYWRATRRRLEAELIRDAILLHANRLDRSLLGPPEQVKSQDPSPADLEQNRARYYGSRRRSVYLPVIRTNLFKFLTLFDFPNAATPVGRRARTTVPTQSLWMMNSQFMIDQAEHIANSLDLDSLNCDQRLSSLYLRLFGRPIGERETIQLRSFLERAERQLADDEHTNRKAWSLLCHALLMSHQFVYVD